MYVFFGFKVVVFVFVLIWSLDAAMEIALSKDNKDLLTYYIDIWEIHTGCLFYKCHFPKNRNPSQLFLYILYKRRMWLDLI